MGVLNTIQRWLLIIILFLTPVFFLPITQEYFVTQKSYLILFGTLIILGLIGIQILMNRKILLVRSPFTRVLLALLAIRGITLFFATPNRIQALYSFPTGVLPFAGLILLYLMVIYHVGTRRERLPIQHALAFGTVLASLVIGIFFFKPLQGANLPAHLAFLQADTFSPIGSAFDSLLLLGFVFVGLGYRVSQDIRSKGSNLLKHGLMATFVLVAIGVIGAQINGALQNGQNLQLPPFSISWYAALETLKSPQSALLGTGIGNFDSVFTLVKPLAYNATELWNVNFSLSRSTLLHVWVESGLLGLAAMLLLFVYVIREIHGLFQKNDQDARMYAMLGAFVGIMLLTFPPSYMALAITFIYIAMLAQQSMAYDHESVTEIDVKKFAPVYVAISMACLVVAGGTGYYAGNAYASEISFKKSIDAVRNNQAQAVYTNIQDAIERYPQRERYRIQFAQINLLLANNLARQEEISDEDRQAIAQFIQQAISEAKVAVALNPNRAANWNNLAVIYRNIINVAEGADAWTVASYREAIRRDPNNPQLALNLGGVFYAAQNYEAAISQFQRAVNLKPDWANAHYNLAWALYQNGDPRNAAAVMNNVIQLIDESSDDYTTAQENLALFLEDAEEATESGTIEGVEGAEGSGNQEPLELPENPEPIISPPIELPENAGPDEEIQAAPDPVGTQERSDDPSSKDEGEGGEDGSGTGTPTPTPGV